MRSNNRECYPEPCENPHVVDITGMDLDKESSGLTPKQKRIMGTAAALLFVKGNAFAFAGCNSENEAELNDRQPLKIDNMVDNGEQSGEQKKVYELWNEPYNMNCAAEMNESGAGIINRERLNDRELSLLDAPISSMVGEDRAAFIYTMSQIYRRWSGATDWHMSENANVLPFVLLDELNEDTDPEDIVASLTMLNEGLAEVSYKYPTVLDKELDTKTRVATAFSDPSSDKAQELTRRLMSRNLTGRQNNRIPERTVTDFDYDDETRVATFYLDELSATDGREHHSRHRFEAFEQRFTCPRTDEQKTIVMFNMLSSTQLP